VQRAGDLFQVELSRVDAQHAMKGRPVDGPSACAKLGTLVLDRHGGVVTDAEARVARTVLDGVLEDLDLSRGACVSPESSRATGVAVGTVWARPLPTDSLWAPLTLNSSYRASVPRESNGAWSSNAPGVVAIQRPIQSV
jgi:hypothetical protein